jgi:predicted protein tyrosine phosphatase
MSTDITTPLLPYRITICGLSELAGHAEAGFSHVVSILDPAFPDPAEFSDYPSHRRVVWRFDDVVQVGHGFAEPSARDVSAILDLGRQLAAEPVEQVLIHCHAGVSRSTATAIVLMVQHNPGREEEAFAELARLRPYSWPNALMIGIADDLLERGGALVGALRQHQKRIARDLPDFTEMLSRYGRAHEILALHKLP